MRKLLKKRQVIIPILVFLALYTAMILIEWRSIESDIAQRTYAILAAKGLDWATAVTQNRGRDVLLIGEAPTEVDLRLAQLLARDVEGVRVVDNRMTLKTLKEQ